MLLPIVVDVVTFLNKYMKDLVTLPLPYMSMLWLVKSHLKNKLVAGPCVYYDLYKERVGV